MGNLKCDNCGEPNGRTTTNLVLCDDCILEMGTDAIKEANYSVEEKQKSSKNPPIIGAKGSHHL